MGLGPQRDLGLVVQYMLIKTSRHTSEDLELWDALEQSDLLYYNTHNMAYREQRAIEEIVKFGSIDKFYVGVSWGKDSIVTLHLSLRSGLSFKTISAKGTYVTKGINALYLDDVRNVFLETYNLDYEEIAYPEYPPKSKQKSLQLFGKKYTSRHILGVRSEESGIRKRSRNIHGISTNNVCRPIIDWPTAMVFAYCVHYGLPLHPNYGFLGGGRWDRNQIRVGGSILGEDGQSFGRLEWEREYYSDVIKQFEKRAMLNLSQR